MLFKIDRVMPARLFHIRIHRKNHHHDADDWVSLQRQIWKLEEAIGNLQHTGQTVVIGNVELPVDEDIESALKKVLSRKLHKIQKELANY